MWAFAFSVLAVLQALALAWFLPKAEASIAWLGCAIVLFEYLLVRKLAFGPVLPSLKSRRSALANERMVLMVEYGQLDPLGELKQSYGSSGSGGDHLYHAGHRAGEVAEKVFDVDYGEWYGLAIAAGLKLVGGVAKGAAYGVKATAAKAKHWMQTSSQERDELRQYLLGMERRAGEMLTELAELDLQIRAEVIASWGGGVAVVVSFWTAEILCDALR